MSLCYIVKILGELYVDIHGYVMCNMVSSPLHVCGCGFNLRLSYNLRYMEVDVDAYTVGEG